MAKRGRKINAKGRSDAERFVPIPYGMATSPAWSTLSGAAVKVYVELRRRYNGKNNGSLTLSMDEAARVLFVGKATVARAFEELAAKGFIAMVRRGQWYGRLATEWAVTDRSLNGNLPTNAWQEWSKNATASVLLRNERGPRKQSLGSQADHIDGATVPLRNRERIYGTATVPVSADSDSSLGSITDHLYNHGVGGEDGGDSSSSPIVSPLIEGAEARSHRERSAEPPDLPPSPIGLAIASPRRVVRDPMQFTEGEPIAASSPCAAGRQR